MRTSKSLSSAAVLAGIAVAAPAMAQVLDPELVIEGKINEITATTITVMGIQINVPSGKANTPTKLGIPLASLNDSLPGRPDGFVGGTAIITGGSLNGKVTASDVFSDVNENVIVGEVTSDFTAGALGLTVNGKEMEALPADHPVIPSTKPMNIFGFQIDPKTAIKGSLISIEGYEGVDGKLYYHALESDTGTPTNAATNEVSVTRVQCRDRTKANEDELQVQGSVHRAAMPTLSGTQPVVSISYLGFNTATRATANVTVTAPLTIDAAAPQYASYKYTSSTRNLSNCPLKVTVAWQGDTDSQIASINTDAEAR